MPSHHNQEGKTLLICDTLTIVILISDIAIKNKIISDIEVLKCHFLCINEIDIESQQFNIG